MRCPRLTTLLSRGGAGCCSWEGRGPAHRGGGWRGYPRRRWRAWRTPRGTAGVSERRGASLHSNKMHKRHGMPELTACQVIPDCEAAQGSMGEVEVGIHLELGHLVSQVQERLGIHDGFWDLLSQRDHKILTPGNKWMMISVSGGEYLLSEYPTGSDNVDIWKSKTDWIRFDIIRSFSFVRHGI